MQTSDKIKKCLLELAEPSFQIFTSKLLPGVENVLGVRLPALRKIAQSLAKSDWRTYLLEASNDTFEEIMLQGMVIGYAKASPEELLVYTSAFIPKINNWSVCDSFCSGFKLARYEPALVWNYLQPYLMDQRTYPVRFGVVMLLFYYIDLHYIEQVIEILDSVKQDDYYVKMAIAWALSICFIKLPEKTMPYLEQNTLDTFTYNKTLQKIVESHCIDAKTKEVIRNMKRKR